MQKRLQKEYSDISSNPPTGVTVQLNEQDKLNWLVTIKGPVGTPYESGKFLLNVKFHENYPFKAPEFKFNTPIFHPNITIDGLVCDEMIGQKDWQPTKTTKQAIELIINLIAQPSIEQSLNNEAMNLYKNDRNKFDERAKSDAQKYSK